MSELKKLSPAELETEILKKDKETFKNTDPLDSHASFFYLYIFRFKQQTRMLSKKQLEKLIASLVGSEYNKDADVNKLLRNINKLNLNSIIRVLVNAVEFPLNEKEVKSFSKNEKETFELLDQLLAEKYVACLESIKEPDQVKVIQDVIRHTHNVTEFKKRKDVEKDAFATANQLICSKTLLIQHTVLEQIKLDTEKKEEVNGTEDNSK